MATSPLTSTVKVKLSILWGKQHIVHPSYKTYDTRWFRETTRAAQCQTTIMIPPPRNTLDYTSDDILHNDILLWLERKGVGWARSEVHTKGK